MAAAGHFFTVCLFVFFFFMSRSTMLFCGTFSANVTVYFVSGAFHHVTSAGSLGGNGGGYFCSLSSVKTHPSFFYFSLQPHLSPTHSLPHPTAHPCSRVAFTDKNDDDNRHLHHHHGHHGRYHRGSFGCHSRRSTSLSCLCGYDLWPTASGSRGLWYCLASSRTAISIGAIE